MISNEELLQFNRQGFIPGPGETEEKFLERIKSLKEFYASPPFTKEALLTDEEWKEARTLTSSFFDSAPDWVVGFYSNKSLFFWQGAAAWISDTEAPIVQIRNSFRKGSHLKFYKKTEVLAHELAHACRMAFHEPGFEEVLAFSLSTSAIRKWGGPFFVRSWEASVYLSLFVLSSVGQLLYFWGGESGWTSLMIFLPWIATIMGGFRLAFMHLVFQKTLKKIRGLIRDPAKALAVALRLTDKEISFFAALSVEKCREIIEKEKSASLRWRLLHLAYF